MTYPFKCSCGYHTEITKHHSEAALLEVCPQCGDVMSRVWTPFSFRVGLVSKKTPAGMIEIGNENANVQNHKAAYDVPTDLSEFPELAALSD